MLEALTSVIDFFGFIIQFFQFLFNIITGFFTTVTYIVSFLTTFYAYVPAFAYPFFIAGIGISIALLILGRRQ